jgi:hypothetical protein
LQVPLLVCEIGVDPFGASLGDHHAALRSQIGFARGIGGNGHGGINIGGQRRFGRCWGRRLRGAGGFLGARAAF